MPDRILYPIYCILESLYLSGTTKSHRGTKDRDLIRFGKEESHIEAVIEKNEVPFKIDIHLKKNSPKGIAINKIPIKRASELFGIINSPYVYYFMHNTDKEMYKVAFVVILCFGMHISLSAALSSHFKFKSP